MGIYLNSKKINNRMNVKYIIWASVTGFSFILLLFSFLGVFRIRPVSKFFLVDMIDSVPYYQYICCGFTMFLGLVFISSFLMTQYSLVDAIRKK